MRIMFVCTGNICRSPLAHRMLEKQAVERGLDTRIEVESSGTDAWHVGEDVDSRMRQTAARHGLDVRHRARKLTKDDLTTYDLIFAMSHGHLRAIRSMSRSVNVHLFREFDPAVRDSSAPPDTPDPYYGGDEGFEEVYQIAQRTCAAILDALENGTLHEEQTGAGSEHIRTKDSSRR